MPASTLKLLTYNLWHGLDGRGVLRMGELEKPARREQRRQQQIADLKNLSADIVFSQETNPLEERLKVFKSDLQMNGEAQSDLCGIKLFHRGPPMNLNSGLAILAKPIFRLRRIAGIKLSGPIGFAGFEWSLQVTESRYALLCEVETPSGALLLIANTHLHHGFAATQKLLNSLEQLAAQDLITWAEHAQLLARMDQAALRRRIELTTLFAEIERIRHDYDGVILGGDFNTDPDSDTITFVKEHGWHDVVQMPLFTWDRERNSYNFKCNEKFAPPMPDFDVPALKRVLMDHMFRRTRLDYVFVSANLAAKISQVSLFGVKPDPETITSDHFGIVVELSL